MEIIGHAGDQPPPADWGRTDALTLSFERAKHVADELVTRGVDRRTMRLVAIGDSEPVDQLGATPLWSADNRRVEVVVRESMIDDYKATLPARMPTSAPTTG
ncbi:MAG: hypothetical protein HY718_13230 [Planctomycetes bacterium]|nr:hypothetical protein [Planctomycetota bacterium]